ncbi:hypothetical protein N665_0036s0124, partial [Sinapis alba]
SIANKNIEKKLLKKIASHATIYHLWKQRNNVIHNHASLPPTEVFRGINREVKNIITSRSQRKHFSTLMALWLR